MPNWIISWMLVAAAVWLLRPTVRWIHKHVQGLGLLVTNDFPPKIGGIQSLLWEWWRRLPPESFAVLTSQYRGTREFDAAQPFHIERTLEPVLLPQVVDRDHLIDDYTLSRNIARFGLTTCSPARASRSRNTTPSRRPRDSR